IRRTPSSNAACASALVLGSTTGAIGLAAAPGPRALCGHEAARSSARAIQSGLPSPLPSNPRCASGRGRKDLIPSPREAGRGLGRGVDLLVTAHLFDAVERDARLAGAGRQALLRLLREFVLREARQRLADRLRVVVVDADRQRLRVAGLVSVERLVLDDDDDLLEL